MCSGTLKFGSNNSHTDTSNQTIIRNKNNQHHEIVKLPVAKPFNFHLDNVSYTNTAKG